MAGYGFVALVTLASLLLYFYAGFQVGRARGRFDVPAPATHGHPEFERYFRVHMNMLEWMVIFLPCLWLAEVFNASWGAISTAVITVLGLVWLLGRYLYMRDYVRDPTTRTRGFAIQAAATAILFILAAVGAVIEIVSQ